MRQSNEDDGEAHDAIEIKLHLYASLSQTSSEQRAAKSSDRKIWLHTPLSGCVCVCVEILSRVASGVKLASGCSGQSFNQRVGKFHCVSSAV